MDGIFFRHIQRALFGNSCSFDFFFEILFCEIIPVGKASHSLQVFSFFLASRFISPDFIFGNEEVIYVREGKEES